MNLPNGLLETLQALQVGLLLLLHAIGLVGDVHGQAAWPFAQRLATETLAIDGGLTRRVAAVLAILVIVVVSALVGALWRRARWLCWGFAVLLLVAAPWPPPALLLADAVPTSFHRSPSRFEAAAIERGLVLYRAHCESCHGDDGGGEGPQAASLPMWPPRLSGGLLWRRADGDLFWHILHGLHDRRGTPTMPGFESRLSDDDVWALIDTMKALAAGSNLRSDGAWAQPVRAPEAWVRCDGVAPERPLQAFRGQRLRIIAGGAALPQPLEDPRFITIVLTPVGADVTTPHAGCVITGVAAYAAYARVAGTDPALFAGAQLLVDRDGWLRAYGRPGQAGWSESDFLCRSDTRSLTARAGRDGLGDLIAAIDADPIRSARFGIAHAR